MGYKGYEFAELITICNSQSQSEIDLMRSQFFFLKFCRKERDYDRNADAHDLYIVLLANGHVLPSRDTVMAVDEYDDILKSQDIMRELNN